VLIDLKQYTQTLNTKSNQDICFITRLENILNINKSFDQKLFRQLLGDEKVILLIDGFDEINSQQRNEIVKILKSFVENQKIQLLFASRPHCTKELILGFNHQSIKMLPLNEENQIDYLTQFWKSEYSDDVGEIKESVKNLIEQFRKTTNYDKFVSFIGNALQLRMAAEVFKPNPINLEDTLRTLTVTEDGSINLYEFYDYFRNQLMITWNRKFPIALNENIDSVERSKSLLQLHQKQALKLIVKDEEFLVEKITKQFFTRSHSLSDEMVAAFGVLTKNSSSDEFEFCHRTFAEFFVAKFLVIELMEPKNSSESLNILCELIAYLANQTDLTKTILNYAMYDDNLNDLLNSDEVLRILNDSVLSKMKIHGDIHLMNQIIRNDDSNLLNLICKLRIFSKDSIPDNLICSAEDDKKCFSVLLSCIVDNFNETDQKEILESHSKWGSEIILFCAPSFRDITKYKQLLEVHKNLFGIKYLLNMRSSSDRHLLDFAVTTGKVQIFDEVFKIYRENLNRDELEEAIKIGQFEFSMLTEASHCPTSEISKSLIEKLKELFPAKEILKTFFLYKKNRTRLHLTFELINEDNFDLIWNFFCELFDETERKAEILKKETIKNLNILHSVVQNRDPKMVKKLFNLITGLIGEVEFKKMIFEQDSLGNTLMHSFLGNFFNKEETIEVLRTELKLNTKDQLKLFTITNKENQTCFDIAQASHQRNFILPEAQSFLSTVELKRFLLPNNYEKYNILQYAAYRGSEENFDVAWQAFRKAFNDEELREIFQQTNEFHWNILMLAADNKETSPKPFEICITAAKSLFKEQEFRNLCCNKILIGILKEDINIEKLKIFQKITIELFDTQQLTEVDC
jgi:hypothetical protein